MNTQETRQTTSETEHSSIPWHNPNYQSPIRRQTKEWRAPKETIVPPAAQLAFAGFEDAVETRVLAMYTAQKRYRQDPCMAVDEAVTEVAASDFPVLEEKILKTIELVKSARVAQAAAERDAGRLREQLEQNQEEIDRLRAELVGLRRDREEAKTRVEKLIRQIDHLIQAEPETTR
jgi:hypothetical protein